MGMKSRKHQVEIIIFSRQTYQNYEQPCQRSQNSDCKVIFQPLKLIKSFPIFFCEEFETPTYINDFLKKKNFDF